MSKISLGILAAATMFMCTIAPTAGQRSGGVADLPDGPGKEAVAQECTKCHGLNNITQSWGFNEKDWRDTFTSMVKLPDDRVQIIAAYLAKNFPEKPDRPKTVVVPGDLKVNIKEWVAPTLGSRPHDPYAAPDGTIYWAGMWADVIGHVDPKTNAIKEYPLPTKRTGPHGLTMDKEGNIWFAGNFGGLIGKLNPKTGEVKEYKMPDPNAKDPHTPLFDKKGMLWFTLQNSNMVGRLNPQTGEIKLVTMPKPRSQPYGMVMMSDGSPFICEFGANRLAKFDLDTMAITEYELPNADSRPRRLTITADDVVYYADYSRGYLGMYNPKTKASKEWPSPSGPKSQPYGIVQVNGIIWYNESAIRPNTIVRFDPKTEKFQSWIIPGGGGVVRNMSVFANGDIAMAESGVNRVAYVQTPKTTQRGTK
jgi:virginiamycin B lyase